MSSLRIPSSFYEHTESERDLTVKCSHKNICECYTDVTSTSFISLISVVHSFVRIPFNGLLVFCRSTARLPFLQTQVDIYTHTRRALLFLSPDSSPLIALFNRSTYSVLFLFTLISRMISLKRHIS